MSYVMDILSGITGVDANHLSIRSSLEFFWPRGPNEYLGRREETGNVDEITQSCNLGNGLNGAFSKDSEETWQRAPCQYNCALQLRSTPGLRYSALTDDIELEALLVRYIRLDPPESHLDSINSFRWSLQSTTVSAKASCRQGRLRSL